MDNATPFSPFVNRRLGKPTAIKRRQSELPSDLIDWDAPEIPELDKQRIIYEDCIRELNEDHDIESVLNEQIFKIAHDAIVTELNTKLRKLEDEVSKERGKVNLMLNQIKMFEENLKESGDRVDQLEKQTIEQRDKIEGLKENHEQLIKEKATLQAELEDLAFRNDEAKVEATHNYELYEQQKSLVELSQRTFDDLKKTAQHYKKLALKQEEALEN